VAHDFNNILTSVIGHTDLILLNLDPQSPLRVNVQEIKKAGERAAALTRQLLAFSRKQMLQPRVLVLNDVVRDLEAMLRRLIGEDIELKTVLDPNTGKVEADPGQIEQVIMNLAVNARDAMPDGGKLTIETRRVNLDRDYQRNHDVVQPGPYLLLAISDTGSGMDEATQSRIFEPFFTTKELGKGTGLGLATVYGVVKQSGGYIWVYSEPGRGTTFKIYLPTVDAHVEAPADEHAPARPLQGSEVVLVVEDDDTVRNLTRDVLKEYGYRVLEADKGAEAIEVVRAYRDPLHLVVTDVVMPGLSAREMIRRLQSMRPEVKVLYMSGYTESAIVHRGALDRDLMLPWPRPYGSLTEAVGLRNMSRPGCG
jgi:two-component system cell cycle sensor histidine kinase/response regulator CckA